MGSVSLRFPIQLSAENENNMMVDRIEYFKRIMGGSITKGGLLESAFPEIL